MNDDEVCGWIVSVQGSRYFGVQFKGKTAYIQAHLLKLWEGDDDMFEQSQPPPDRWLPPLPPNESEPNILTGVPDCDTSHELLTYPLPLLADCMSMEQRDGMARSHEPGHDWHSDGISPIMATVVCNLEAIGSGITELSFKPYGEPKKIFTFQMGPGDAAIFDGRSDSDHEHKVKKAILKLDDRISLGLSVCSMRDQLIEFNGGKPMHKSGFFSIEENDVIFLQLTKVVKAGLARALHNGRRLSRLITIIGEEDDALKGEQLREFWKLVPALKPLLEKVIKLCPHDAEIKRMQINFYPMASSNGWERGSTKPKKRKLE